MTIDTIKDVEWLMPWSQHKMPGKTEDEMMFDEEKALAHMLINEVIFLNDHWWEGDWPDAAKKTTSLNVNCNDVFAWGCADAEEMPHSELKNLYMMWKKDPEWGAAIWCMKQRNQMPQRPVEDRIRKAGIWIFEELGLASNTKDAEVSAIFGKAKAAIQVAAANKGPEAA